MKSRLKWSVIEGESIPGRAGSSQLRSSVLLVLLPIAAGMAACTGENRAKQQAAVAETAGCSAADTTPVELAVLQFITAAVPRPMRFLTAAGSDSALPEDGFRVLQDKGPTYFYTAEPKGQAQVREKLINAGPWPALLVVYHGSKPNEKGDTVVVTLGGHYVTGKEDGNTVPKRTIAVHCDAAKWKVVTAP